MKPVNNLDVFNMFFLIVYHCKMFYFSKHRTNESKITLASFIIMFFLLIDFSGWMDIFSFVLSTQTLESFSARNR